MTDRNVLPGLVITSVMLDAALAGVADHATDLAVPAEDLLDPMSWWAVPGPDGAPYKWERTFLDSVDRTVRLNVWRSPDLRDNERSKPHSHPWPFTAHVLLGGYEEDRYVPDAGLVLRNTKIEHTEGGRNDVGLHVYHEVTHIEHPGRTVSLMVCGRGERGRWGYLDPDTGEHRRAEREPGFDAMLRAVNPHHYRRNP